MIAIIGILSSIVVSSLGDARKMSCLKNENFSENCKEILKSLTFEEKEKLKKKIAPSSPVEKPSCDEYADTIAEKLPARCLNYWKNKI